MNNMRRNVPGVVTLAVGILTWVAVMGAHAAGGSPALEGKYEVLKGETSTHQPGKVKLTEFADFYCPHCHLFEQNTLPVLQKEFGSKLDVTMVGFPVIDGKLPTAFEMYEQARTMGKGEEMRKVLFRTIHKDRTHVLDRLVRESLIKEVGLDVAAFEAGLGSGKPVRALEAGRAWGLRINVRQTPTIVLDGNLKVEAIDAENLKTVIRSILAADSRR
jgi:thiol:disulfide interchange protein DsbA